MEQNMTDAEIRETLRKAYPAVDPDKILATMDSIARMDDGTFSRFIEALTDARKGAKA